VLYDVIQTVTSLKSLLLFLSTCDLLKLLHTVPVFARFSRVLSSAAMDILVIAVSGAVEIISLIVDDGCSTIPRT
jgi:hypothetical protein